MFGLLYRRSLLVMHRPGGGRHPTMPVTRTTAERGSPVPRRQGSAAGPLSVARRVVGTYGARPTPVPRRELAPIRRQRTSRGQRQGRSGFARQSTGFTGNPCMPVTPARRAMPAPPPHRHRQRRHRHIGTTSTSAAPTSRRGNRTVSRTKEEGAPALAQRLRLAPYTV